VQGYFENVVIFFLKRNIKFQAKNPMRMLDILRQKEVFNIKAFHPIHNMAYALDPTCI